MLCISFWVQVTQVELTRREQALEVYNSGEMLELMIQVCRQHIDETENIGKRKQSRKMGSEAFHHFFKFWQKRAKETERGASKGRGKAGEGGAMTGEEGKASQGGNR